MQASHLSTCAARAHGDGEEDGEEPDAGSRDRAIGLHETPQVVVVLLLWLARGPPHERVQ
ncbi:unnamed protein product [Spirodela intermedia]|uniref:Uncharacterized protein n=1 Tax=Spirodela intermedia TaxID=51605 RepID=A0A7I8K980_SPIIN|nr:unnamed protein product [Spirodela intermedia]